MAFKKSKNSYDTPRRQQQRLQMKSKSKPKINKSIKQYVKKAISRKAENKMAFRISSGGDTTATEMIPVYPIIQFSGAGSVPSGVSYVVPAIAQGVSEGQRIGNKLLCKGLYLKGHLTINWSTTAGGYNTPVTTPEIYVRMVILDQKDYLQSGFNSTSILDKAGSNFAPDGTMSSLTLPVDRKQFNVYYEKIFKIRNPLFWPNTNAAYVNANQNTCHLFSCKLKVPKNVLYSSNAETIPNNFNPQICAWFIDPSNITRASNTVACEYSFVSTMYYEDS